MFPPLPEVPDTQRATGRYPLRFEDITQDGRVHFEPLVASLDAAIWRPMLGKNEVTQTLYRAGVRPIITSLALEVGPARLSLGATLTADGVYELAHEPDGQGGAVRLFLNMWTTIWAPPGTDRSPASLVGRLYAEHQLTRLSSSPADRRVVALPGGLPLPARAYRARAREEVLSGPEVRAWLEPEASPDTTLLSFGLSHTDVNQHVNSLVYPRLFGDAALRRFASLGQGTRTLATHLDIAFRKPFFAGDTARIDLRAFGATGPGELGAAGTYSVAAGGKPHVYVRLGFSGTPGA